MAQNCQINLDVLNEIPSKCSSTWAPFSEEEFISTIAKSNNLSTPGPDKISWRYLKSVIKDKVYLIRIIHITNAYIDLDYWPSHFKTSITIVTPKPNKKLYNFPKLFRPIILLNTIGKLIEKVIGKHLQFHVILNNFVYLC